MRTFLFCLLLSQWAGGQTILPASSNQFKKEIFVSAALEPELVTTAGYSQVIHSTKKNSFILGSAIKLAPLALSHQTYKMNLFGQVSLGLGKKSNLLVNPQLYYAHLSNRAGTLNGFGFGLDLTPFWKGAKWNKGFTIGWQNTAFTHVRNSDAAKETFNGRYGTDHGEGPRDRWYWSTANRFRLGAVIAHSFNDHARIQVGFGGLAALQKQAVLLGFSLAQVPFFVDCGLHFGLK